MESQLTAAAKELETLNETKQHARRLAEKNRELEGQVRMVCSYSSSSLFMSMMNVL
jgi:hypothetical protein